MSSHHGATTNLKRSPLQRMQQNMNTGESADKKGNPRSAETEQVLEHDTQVRQGTKRSHQNTEHVQQGTRSTQGEKGQVCQVCQVYQV